ncbi:4990_t:CDS:2 [Racocetra fulgida]|uniref:4990_t:CDS:1 n=1 Tax=Racocetra fulgida TaxID=60492 RepID=A0A9N9HTS9_9GLOM|nr:4990_t:CDS:2 [Racocetra fulgida]
MSLDEIEEDDLYKVEDNFEQIDLTKITSEESSNDYDSDIIELNKSVQENKKDTNKLL